MALPPNIQTGSRGPVVSDLQIRLKMAGYPNVLAADGIFGPLTDTAVRWFQAQAGLAQVGVVDERTWTALLQRTGSMGSDSVVLTSTEKPLWQKLVLGAAALTSAGVLWFKVISPEGSGALAGYSRRRRRR